MNDHNLEDLIVEEIQPKSSTGKNILTIFALLIIILFVAIFLMRTLLDITPSIEEHNLTFEQNNSKEIHNELTLSNIVSLDNPHKANSNLSDIVEEDAPSQPQAPKEQITAIETNATETSNTDTVKIQEDTVKEEEPLVEDASNISSLPTEKTEIATAVIPTKTKVVNKPITKVTQKHKQTVTKPTQKSKKTHYYIQVGSYRKHPSTEFLAIIRKTGFRYKVTSTNSRGIRQLLIGAYSSRKSANHALKQVQDRINKKAFVVKR